MGPPFDVVGILYVPGRAINGVVHDVRLGARLYFRPFWAVTMYKAGSTTVCYAAVHLLFLSIISDTRNLFQAPSGIESGPMPACTSVKVG